MEKETPFDGFINALMIELSILFILLAAREVYMWTLTG